MLATDYLLVSYSSEKKQGLLSFAAVSVWTENDAEILKHMQITRLMKAHDSLYCYIALSPLVSQQETANPFEIIQWCSGSVVEWNGRKNVKFFQDTKQYDGNSDMCVFMRQAYSYLHIFKVQGNSMSLVRVIYEHITFQSVFYAHSERRKLERERSLILTCARRN